MLKSQKGNTVPIARVPRAAIPRPTQENQESAPADGCSTSAAAVETATGVLGTRDTAGRSRTAAPPRGVRTGVRRDDEVSTGVAGMPPLLLRRGVTGAVTASCSMNIVAMTRR